MGYEFARFENDEYVPDVPGIYVVRDLFDRVLDVGESDTLRTRLSCHDRRRCWERNRSGPIHYLVISAERVTIEARRSVEELLRRVLNPSCGIR